MVTNDELMRVFWPSDLPRDKTPGILLGWRNSEHDMVVVTVLQDVELRNVEHALQVRALFRSSPHPIDHIFDRCGGNPPRALGAVNPPEPPIVFNPAQVVIYTNKSGFPELYCPQDSNLTVQIVMFDRPNPTKMQYMSLKPMSLALKDNPERSVVAESPPDRMDEEELLLRKRKAKLVEKLKLHTVVVHPPTPKELSLPTILNQINSSYELAALMQKNIGLVGVRSQRTLSVSERVVESANNLWEYIWFCIWQALTVWVYPAMTRLFVLGLVALRIGGELILRILDWRLLPHHAALKDISATAQQVDIRLQQFCYWPIQYLTLRKRKVDWESIPDSNPEYIRFYNSLWLVANDIIIGIALGSYVVDNANFVAAQLDFLIKEWSIQGLDSMITWLTMWPAGLKLNRDLAIFLGGLFQWVIKYWGGHMDTLRSYLPGIIQFIGYSAYAGATMPISLFSDLITLLTLHIHSFYVASARIYNWQLTIIISLFHLFRGKKRNILRKRIDSCDYDLDQLLLGTILFTLLFFLLPTVLVFYLTFAIARMAIITVKAVLDTQLAFLNHFPLFALMLRVKDSRRLPGGISFDLASSPSPNVVRNGVYTAALTSHIRLRPIPLPLSHMFNEYSALGARIRAHYIAPSVFLCLVTGRFVPPIPRRILYSLQYSMLPSTRVAIAELWARLNDALVEVKETWGRERGVRRAGLALNSWGRGGAGAGGAFGGAAAARGRGAPGLGMGARAVNGHVDVRERSWEPARRMRSRPAGVR